MIGQLSSNQIEMLLQSEVIARIGCHVNGHTYIVPIAYVYDRGALIGYSPEGLKLRMMRQNPAVGVEVDQIETLTSWRSVIATGTFEELSGAQAEESLDRLTARFRTYATVFSHGLDQHARALNRKRFCVYRIVLTHITGRFEKPD